ncbi:ABC transporter permease [Sansalvadorimonas sp. 2012CJ34-2]|uniref:ABC transporter permease n=1 Tax=Parendozoicomonas callyspongiae TaxID=2942213 RepID=A0ABT0PKS4_9GAMM|nr:ABC transporter permease [Sansalvadorimonas sp. 2012CJ34-2]MCL6271327.1 ABC transporter permease [Sansalvadorimonas sp. 2012CJ34-2]
MLNKHSLSTLATWPWAVLTPVLLFVAIAIFALWISPYDPTTQNYSAVLQGSSWEHWLGTDYLGRDLLSRIITGAQVSLVAMSIVLIAALIIGVTIGSFAGYVGGKTELVLISAIDIILSLPSLVVALAFIGIIGPGYWSMIAALTMAWWANYARMSRAVVTSELHQPYIEAARVMGASHLHIFVRHILPHVLALVVVYASADAGALVLAIATLSFLGLGVEPPTPEWGQMLVDGMNYLEQYPRLVVLPGLALTLVVSSFNLLGEHFALKKVPRGLTQRHLKILKRLRAQEEARISELEASA